MSCRRANPAPLVVVDPKVLFREALAHCRWKSVLDKTIDEKINISHFDSGMTFDQVFTKVYALCKPVKGLGRLTIYDLTSALCAHYKIPIDKIYIIGKGPKRAVKLLGLKTKNIKVGNIYVDYVDIEDVVSAFKEKGFELEPALKTSTNGDEFESFLCNWQKDK